MRFERRWSNEECMNYLNFFLHFLCLGALKNVEECFDFCFHISIAFSMFSNAKPSLVLGWFSSWMIFSFVTNKLSNIYFLCLLCAPFVSFKAYWHCLIKIFICYKLLLKLHFLCLLCATFVNFEHINCFQVSWFPVQVCQVSLLILNVASKLHGYGTFDITT